MMGTVGGLSVGMFGDPFWEEWTLGLGYVHVGIFFFQSLPLAKMDFIWVEKISAGVQGETFLWFRLEN